MTSSVALPLVVPLVAAVGTLLLRGRPREQRAVSLAAVVVELGAALGIVAMVSGRGVVVTRMGGWPPRLAISLVADPFSAVMLVISGAMVLVCLCFAVARGEDRLSFYHPLIQVLAAGVAGALLTSDLFNLFVFVEVMLIASYVLLALGGSVEQLRAAGVYVAMNLLGSSLLLAGVALTYAVAGTVNLAELAGMAPGATGTAVSGTVVLVALAVKGALVPVHGWLPRAYPAAPPAVAALFSGLLTKVAIYAMYRIYAVMLQGATPFRTPFLLIASMTMLVGVLGAIGRGSMRGILSFHMVSQVGYMLMGLGLFGSLGLTAGIFYMLQYIIVKTALFLAAGAVETSEGTGDLDRLGGLAGGRRILAVGFLLAALSLAGLPPLSGFLAKLLLIRAAFVHAEYGVAAMAIIVSFLTLASMVKIWNGVFWGRVVPCGGDSVPAPSAAMGVSREDPPGEGRAARPSWLWLDAPVLVLATVSMLIGLWPQGMMTLTDRAAAILADPAPYVEVVLGR